MSQDYQLNLENFMSQENVAKPVSECVTEGFACCSKYRECSNAKMCLISNEDYASGCIYRASLERGQIYYGKNAVGFSMNRYREIISAISNLSAYEAGVLDTILLELCEHQRNTQSIIVRTGHAEILSPLGLFSISPLGETFPSLCKKRILKKRIPEGPERDAWKAADKKNREQNAKEGTENRIPFIETWLNTEGVELRDKLAWEYRQLSVLLESRRYVEELYWDRLGFSAKKHIYMVSPLLEDGWLSDAE